MTIILDGMGSDHYPDPEIQAALNSVELFGEEIILVGDEAVLRPKLDAANKKGLAVKIEHAPDVLGMGEHAVEDSKKKPNNSMAVGMRLIKSGQAQAFVTAGNTGSAMFNALRILGRIKGVQRPALTAFFPTRKGFCAVLDIGANAECRPEYLAQFAIMGSLYTQKILGISRPRVGLLSNGEEAGKGNQLVQDAHKLLTQSGLNFIGNVEAKELFGGDVDVVVTDGFTGNVLLKSSEAVARLMTDTLKAELSASTITKIGAVLAMPALKRLRKMMESDEVGAAPLLGIDGLVFVGHGRSNARALTSAIRVARQAVESNLVTDLRQNIQDRLTQLETAQAASNPTA